MTSKIEFLKIGDIYLYMLLFKVSENRRNSHIPKLKNQLCGFVGTSGCLGGGALMGVQFKVYGEGGVYHMPKWEQYWAP